MERLVSIHFRSQWNPDYHNLWLKLLAKSLHQKYWKYISIYSTFSRPYDNMHSKQQLPFTPPLFPPLNKGVGGAAAPRPKWLESSTKEARVMPLRCRKVTPNIYFMWIYIHQIYTSEVSHHWKWWWEDCLPFRRTYFQGGELLNFQGNWRPKASRQGFGRNHWKYAPPGMLKIQSISG